MHEIEKRYVAKEHNQNYDDAIFHLENRMFGEALDIQEAIESGCVEFPKWIAEVIKYYGTESLVTPCGLKLQARFPRKLLAASDKEGYDTTQVWYAYKYDGEIKFKVVNVILEKL